MYNYRYTSYVPENCSQILESEVVVQTLRCAKKHCIKLGVNLYGSFHHLTTHVRRKTPHVGGRRGGRGGGGGERQWRRWKEVGSHQRVENMNQLRRTNSLQDYESSNL